MLSSIHPLGERGRNNRFPVTAAAYVAGSAIGGASIGFVAGSVGWLAGWSAPAGVIATVVGVAVVLDLFGVTVPSSHRQVNERWLDTYRGVVYGFGYGFQLGAAVTTIVPTWLVPAMLVTAALSGSTTTGLVIGVAFGLVRGAALLTVAHIDHVDQLRSFHRSLHRHRSGVRVGLLALVTVVGATTVLVT
jgi:sulfite exporter TauE/SafE